MDQDQSKIGEQKGGHKARRGRGSWRRCPSEAGLSASSYTSSLNMDQDQSKVGEQKGGNKARRGRGSWRRLPSEAGLSASSNPSSAATEQDMRAIAAHNRRLPKKLPLYTQTDLMEQQLTKECCIRYLPVMPGPRRKRAMNTLGDPLPTPLTPGVPTTELPASLPLPWKRQKTSAGRRASDTSSGGPDHPEGAEQIPRRTPPPSPAGTMEILKSNDVEDEGGMDAGSDIDVQEENHRLEDDTVAEAEAISMFTDILTPEMHKLLMDIDRANDDVFRNFLPDDIFSFDWQHDMFAFQGTRETFTGTPGPTFPVSELEKPVDAFLKIWDDDILDIIVKETNRYAAQCISSGISRCSRSNRWQPTNKAEIYTFFAMQIHQSMVPLTVEKEYFASPSSVTDMSNWKTIIVYDRWLLLKKYLHFRDNSLPSDPLSLDERKLYKIQPIIDHLNSKFQSLYMPKQTLALDESLLKWMGRLSFVQKMARKAAKVGIKSYELCESSSGYLWNFYIYAGKDTRCTAVDTTVQPTDTDGPMGTPERPTHTDRPANSRIELCSRYPEAPKGATAKIVYDLASPLFHKGYTIVMDNFFNSPLLARCLKRNGVDCYGTLRLCRDRVPESMKSLSKTSLNSGEILSSTSGDINVMVWKDNALVSMLTTYHQLEVGTVEKYGSQKYKPQLVLDYNKTMGGVDKKDQLLAGFPLERKRNMVWYKKLFRRLMNASILNAYIIYRCKDISISHRDFRRQVADGLLSRFFTPRVPPPVISSHVKMTRQLPGHLNKIPRPVLKNNHFSVKIDETCSKRMTCKWCKMLGKNGRKTTRKCDICNVALCSDCMKPYHTGVRP